MYVHQKKGRPGFYVELNINGRRARPRAGDTREQAERIAAMADDLKAAGKSLEQILAELPWPKRPRGERRERMTHKLATERHLEGAKSEMRPSTYAKRRQTATRLGKARWAGLPIESVRPNQIVAWAESYRASHGPSALNHALVVVSAGFVWALRHGHIDSNPAQGLKLHAPEKRRELWWTADQCREVLDACTNSVRPFVRLLLLTGMRRGEAAKLEWGNFNAAERTLEITAEISKTHEARTVHLTDAAHELVLSLNPFSGGRLFKRTDGGPFSEGYLRDALRKVRMALGHKRATKLLPKGHGWHVCRHSYITHALASGANITNLGKQVGQRSADITARYAHAIPQAVRETAEAVGRALAV